MLPRNVFRITALLAGMSFSVFGQDAVEGYYTAIRNNDMAALSALVKAGGVNGKDKRGSTPLHYSAAYGSLESMRILLAAGAELNARNDFEATPLIWSAAEPEKVRMLVAKGADVNARTKMRRTALYIAAANDGSSATVKFLLEHGAKVDGSELLAAAGASDMASMRLLLDAGADAKFAAPNGMTPLVLASMNGNLKMVETLLAHGADANASTDAFNESVKNGKIALSGLTPLLVGSNYGPVELVKALLDAGAKVNAQDGRKMTPLMMSVTSDHADPRIIRLLLERGADANIKDVTGLTAGDWAKKSNNPVVLRELGLSAQKADAQASRVIIPAKLLERADAHAAAAKSIALLQRSSGDFFKQGGCGGCHAQNMTSIAVNAAAANRVPVNMEAKAGELKGAQLGLSSLEQPLLQRGDPPVPDILTYSLMQFASENAPADRTTDAMAHNLMAQQKQAGNWHVGGISRPPAGDGDFTRTATAVRGLQVYGPAGRKAEVQKRVERAAAWLATTNAKTTEDLTMQLMGLKWAGAPKKTWEPGLRRLVAQQREDGGWAQTADLASDAYATGEVLFAMHEVGVPVNDPAWTKGIQFLLQTQQADGSWMVKSRAPKIQPYFTTIFPYEHDQWISNWATGWAAAALSYAPMPVHTAKR